MQTRPSAHDSGPGILVPPPLYFFAGWAVAWLLDERIGFALDGAGASIAQLLLAGVFVVSGLALIGSAVGRFRRADTSVLPMRAASALVTAGAYRWTRNPMYLGMTAVYVGLAAAANLAWPVVLLPIVLAALSLFVIEREERYLSLTFGRDYEDYRGRVRRWF